VDVSAITVEAAVEAMDIDEGVSHLLSQLMTVDASGRCSRKTESAVLI
jgi:hypothetical protein